MIQFIVVLHRQQSLPSGLFPLGFLTQTLYAPLLSAIRATRLVHLIILDFFTRTMLDKSIDHKNPRYIAFFPALLPRPSRAQISFLAPYSRILSPYFPHSIGETHFYTHTQQKAKLFMHILNFIFSDSFTT
jgi:hypothetical protein